MHLAGQERGDAGYAMAALLVSLGVMAILMTMALPVWRQQARREKEAELIFRGEQYARAVALFQRRVAGAYPPNLDVLVDQKYLRKKYKDPMTKDGEFEILYQATASPQAVQGSGPGQTRPPTSGGPQSQRPSTASPTTQSSAAGAGGGRGGVVGVVSKSKEQSIRLYKGRSRYNEWQFLYTPATVRPTGPVAPQNQPGGGRTIQGGPGPTGPRPQGPQGPFGPAGPPRPPQGGADPTRPFPIGPPPARPGQPPR